MENPQAITPRSIMPAYPHLLAQDLDYPAIQRKVDAMVMLGVPYGDAVRDGAAARIAREQADAIAKGIVEQGGPAGLEAKQIVALTAYLQRLGQDIRKLPVAAASARVAGGGR